MAEPERLAALDTIATAIWQELGRATLDRQHEWRTAVLATVAGEWPDARTVVLREVDRDRRRVVIYSDARAGKIGQLAVQPQAVMVLWSKRLSWQLRLRLQVEVESDGLAVTTRWARVKMSPNAGDYLSANTPGSPLQAPGVQPAAAERATFAVLDAEVLSMDWLELHRDGHRRAAFDADGARWLQP
jgi:pyridoxamine 5'-phosphate oxidase